MIDFAHQHDELSPRNSGTGSLSEARADAIAGSRATDLPNGVASTGAGPASALASALASARPGIARSHPDPMRAAGWSLAPSPGLPLPGFSVGPVR